MKRIFRTSLAALALISLASPTFATDSDHPARAAALVTMTPDELKWVPNPANADVSMAVLWGDPAKGPHGAFHRFKPGFNAGLHTHSADFRIAVVSGTLIAGPEGGPEKKLPAGSYEYQPHGVKHVTKCDAGGPCLIFVAASGKFDLVQAEAKK